MQDAKTQEVIKPASVDYTSVGEEKKRKEGSKKHIKILMPNQRMITGFVVVILGVLLFTAATLPYNSILTAKEGARISIGYPLTFLLIELSKNTIFNILALIQDLLIYLGLAYIINIFLNLLSNMSKSFKTKESADETPTTFKDQKITSTDKLAEKVSQ